MSCDRDGGGSNLNHPTQVRPSGPAFDVFRAGLGPPTRVSRFTNAGPAGRTCVARRKHTFGFSDLRQTKAIHRSGHPDVCRGIETQVLALGPALRFRDTGPDARTCVVKSRRRSKEPNVRPRLATQVRPAGPAFAKRDTRVGGSRPVRKTSNAGPGGRTCVEGGRFDPQP